MNFISLDRDGLHVCILYGWDRICQARYECTWSHFWPKYLLSYPSAPKDIHSKLALQFWIARFSSIWASALAPNLVPSPQALTPKRVSSSRTAVSIDAPHWCLSIAYLSWFSIKICWEGTLLYFLTWIGRKKLKQMAKIPPMTSIHWNIHKVLRG